MSLVREASVKQIARIDQIAIPRQHRNAARERPASFGSTTVGNLSCRKNPCPRRFHREMRAASAATVFSVPTFLPTVAL